MVERHEKVVFGDNSGDEPKPGMFQALQAICKQIVDLESTQSKLSLAVQGIVEQDKMRTAWALGAKWVIGIMGAGIAFVAGIYFGKH